MRMMFLLVMGILIEGVVAAPVISGVGANPVRDTWAQINWQTNISANSVVDYGLTTSYDKVTTVAAAVTTHKVQLNQLAPETTYHYRVRSTSGSETSVSGDFAFTTSAAAYGAESNPTGDPIGGGTGYHQIYTPAEATVVVSTAAQLLGALSTATSGAIIYIDDNAKIDLTGSTNIMIPGGVTIASGRGRNGSLGGAIFTTDFTGTRILFKTKAPGVRLTGLRLYGPHSGAGRTIPYSYGIQTLYNNNEIDNCEIWGWNYAAIATAADTDGLWVHHCYIHHNQRNGLGYGVAPSRSYALIEGNLFDYCRHAVASSGQSPSSYEARYNLHLEHSLSHLFDMHGANDFEKYIMQGNWRFDESSGAVANDTSEYGGNDAALKNFSTDSCWVTGKIVRALQFDGVDDYVDCGNASNLATSSFSVIAWIKPAAVSGTQTIASKADTAGTGKGYSLRLVGSALEGTIYNGAGNRISTTTGAIPAGAWTHVAMTFNGTTMLLYVNGALSKSYACTGVSQSSTHRLTIGRDAAASSSYFSGLIDEVRYYSSPITAADVTRHYKLFGDIAGDTIRIHHNTTRSMHSSVLVRGVPTIGCWVDYNWFWRAYDSEVAYQKNGFGNFYVSDNLFGLLETPPDPANGTMLGEWRFNEGSGSTAADSSGHGRTGTLTNMNTGTCWVSGQSGTALEFDGVNDTVNCGATLTQTDNIGIDFWVKFNAFAEHQYVLRNNVFDVYNRSNWAGNKLWFRYKINEAAYGGDTAWINTTAVQSTTELATGVWYHVTCTRNGDRMRIFINDQLDRELDCMAGFTLPAAGTLYLGGDKFTGVLDEVKIFTPGPDHPDNHTPTLTWTGEAGYSADGLEPQTGTGTDTYTFRVKYTDADGDAPMLGYPRLRILRGGTEFGYVTPLVMMAADTSAFASGRVYTCKVNLPRGADYSYYFDALDSVGEAATGAATVATTGPTVTSGNNAPVLEWPDETNFVESGVWPGSGDTDTTFTYRIKYMDIDNDPPKAGYPKVRIMRGGTDIPGSPFTMNAADAGSLLTGRKYELIKRLQVGSYTYQYLAYDDRGTAADPSVATSGPSVIAGSTVWAELYTTAAGPITTTTLPVQVVFNDVVTGFAQGDVSVTNGTIGGFSGSGANYSFNVTPVAAGVVTVSVPAGVCVNGSSAANQASNQISIVYYPPAGADEIWVGHGYPGARLGTYTDPFDQLIDGIRWVKSGGVIWNFPGSNPERIRMTKPVKLKAYGGTATIGKN